MDELEAENQIPKVNQEEYRKIIEDKLNIANGIITMQTKAGLLNQPELKFLKKHAYELYRDSMNKKGISGNQIKPPRVLDTLEKRDFFFGMIEEDKHLYISLT